MTTITTRDALVALVQAHDAARIDAHLSDGDVDATTADLGHVLGSGVPASEDFADGLGCDYICALEDGTIAAWGSDTVLTHGLIGRDLVFYSPAEQAA